MNRKVKNLILGALMAALYVALCYLQNFLLPGSASFAIQFRVAEAMLVLAFFTPAAIPGLSVGCLLFNISAAGALPLDMVVGTGATALSAWLMYATRGCKLWGLPLLGLFMPALWNGLLVGWELSVYIGGGFWFNAICVAIGEAGVLLTLGALLYRSLARPGIAARIFA